MSVLDFADVLVANPVNFSSDSAIGVDGSGVGLTFSGLSLGLSSGDLLGGFLLCFSVLLFALLLGDLVGDEGVESLLPVGVLSGDEEDCTDKDSEKEYRYRIPHQDDGVIDAELKHAPPVDGLESPEEDECEDDSDVVANSVLVDALVVGVVDLEVSISKAISEGSVDFGFSDARGRLDLGGHT